VVKMFKAVTVVTLVVSQVVTGQEDKFQKCCLEEKLYSPIDRACHFATDQGPCRQGEWLVMTKDSDGLGVCKKAPCASNHEVLVDGFCRSKYQGGLCQRGKRPWYSVYGEWKCMRHRVFLPFGQQKEPYDKAWDRCNVKYTDAIIVA